MPSRSRTEWTTPPRVWSQRRWIRRIQTPSCSWIRSFCLDSSNPAFAAAVLVCVARQPGVGTARWREELVRGGLAVDEVEVRDAAMQAAEYWADPGFLDVLSAHSEPVGWLDEYRRGVMDDLGG